MNFEMVRNVLFNWAGMLASIIYALVMTPFIIKGLGNDKYGIWTLIMTCAGYITILDFGVQSALNRFIAKHVATKSYEDANAVFSNALFIYTLMGLIALLGGLILSANIDRWFSIPDSEAATASIVMAYMATFVAVQLPLNSYGAILVANHRFDIVNTIQVTTVTLQGVGLWLLLQHDTSLTSFALFTIVIGLSRHLLLAIYARKILPSLAFKLRSISVPAIKSLVTFSGITFLAVIATYVIFQSDNVVIGVFLTPEAIAIYTIGFMLADYAANIVGKMSNTLTPIFSNREAKGEHEQVYELLYSGGRFAALIGIPIGLAAFIVGDEFIQLWLGSDYAQSYNIMILLMLARMVNFPSAPVYSMLYGIGKHKVIVYTASLEAICNISLSIYLVRDYGLLGVAIGTLIPMVITSLLFPYVASRYVGFKYGAWLQSCILKPLPMLLAFFASIYAVSLGFKTTSWSTFIYLSATIVVIYVICFCALGLSATERHLILSKLKIWGIYKEKT